MIRMFFYILLTLFGGFFLYNNFIYAVPQSYQNNTPQLKLTSYFRDTIEAKGFLQDITGRNYNDVSVTTKGKWKGDYGNLYRYYKFNKLENIKQKLQIKFDDSNKFMVKIDGGDESYEGQQYGNAVNLKYDLPVSYKNIRLNLQINEWFYYLGNGRLINKVVVSKFGVPLGTATITYDK